MISGSRGPKWSYEVLKWLDLSQSEHCLSKVTVKVLTKSPQPLVDFFKTYLLSLGDKNIKITYAVDVVSIWLGRGPRGYC